MQDAGLTTEESLEQAQGHVTALILVTVVYCKENTMSCDDWVTFVGTAFAPTREAVRGQGALAAARAAARNMVSSGATGVSISGDESRAEVRSQWPEEEILSVFSVTRDDSDRFLQVFAPIAAHLGLRYEQTREGEEICMVFAR